MLGLLLQVMEYLEVIGFIRAYLPMLRLLLQIMVYLEGVYLEEIGLILLLNNVVTVVWLAFQCLMMVIQAVLVHFPEVIWEVVAMKTVGLSDGDLRRLGPSEEAYRTKPPEVEDTFGDYAGNYPPGLNGIISDAGRMDGP
ncbi:unnamed protein product [Symbiodinium sp. CCMP2592]|nr:unnamed protein product [Symbiodinium sp. CCMP2592]